MKGFEESGSVRIREARAGMVLRKVVAERARRVARIEEDIVGGILVGCGIESFNFGMGA